MTEHCQVWGVSMVKDEADVIDATVSHLVTQKVDGLLIADNGSSDGTREILEALQSRFSAILPIVVVEDREPAYYQSQKMTALAEQAYAEHGATWIVPFDADELWYGDTSPLGYLLAEYADNVDCILARLYNHFPTSGDASDPNPFTRIAQRDPTPAPLPKVALRWQPGMVIHQGNHGADGVHTSLRERVSIRHFPWRSFEQFERKVRNGAAAYRLTTLPEEMGGHWRGYGQILESGGPEALRRDVWEQWFFDPPLKLESSPAPFMRAYP